MAGLAEVFERHCSLPLKALLAPAIDYAGNGVVLNQEQAYFKKILSPILILSEAGRKVYSPGGVLLKEGEIVVKNDMAKTLEYLAEEGLNAFYTGEISEKILSHFGDGGLITRQDLESYRVEVRKPLEINYRGKKIYSNPPPSSSGGCLLAFSLKLIEGYDLGKMGQNSAEALRLIYEVMKLTDEARGEDFDHKVYDADIVDTFLDKKRLESYRQRIGLDLPSGSDYERPSTGNTTHISVVDEMGNAASVTTSNGEGCGHMIPGAGVMLNNMLGEEDINPHGFHTQPAGSRMSSMMAPTIVMDGNSPSLVLGSGGSNRIKNAIFQVILNIIDHKMPVYDAVNSARAHWDKKAFQLEAGISAGEIEKIKKVGIPVNSWEIKNMYFGGVHTVVSGAAAAELTGAGDLRRGGVCLSV
jgi:gamma-glutamyltranspeptidase/glutathione hydrolase